MIHFVRQLRRKRPKRRMAPVNHRRKFYNIALAAIILVLVHSAAMVATENLKFEDAAWLTATTMTTVGYGDLFPKTKEGRITTVVLMYIIGIALLGTAISTYQDGRDDRRVRQWNGLWRWKLKNPIIIMNAPEHYSTEYFLSLVQEIRSSEKIGHLDINIFTGSWNELPVELADMNVVFSKGHPYDLKKLKTLPNLFNSSAIVILAKGSSESESDSRTFDILCLLKDLGVKTKIIAECVREENRERFKKAGADAVIRPMRAYPEIIVRAIVAPGSEEIIEDMLTKDGDECKYFELGDKIKILSSDPEWKMIVMACLEHNIGTPLGFRDTNGIVIKNPDSKQSLRLAHGVYIFVKEDVEIPENVSPFFELIDA